MAQEYLVRRVLQFVKTSQALSNLKLTEMNNRGGICRLLGPLSV